MKNKAKRKKHAQIILDTLHRLFPKVKPSLNYVRDWEFLVAVILSAQCTDARVNTVTEKLFHKYKTVKEYTEADIHVFEKDIHSTGFYRNKAKNILATARIIHLSYQDTLPRTMEEMLTLPGVARKTANVVLGNLYGIVEGVAVDTHVRRLSNLYGLVNSQNPQIIERELMEILPKNEWVEFTMRMIEYGRKFCPAKKHDHVNCPISIALSKE